MKSFHILSVPVFFLFLIACAREPDSFGSNADAAIPPIRNAYKAEKWRPDSTSISAVEYFPQSPRRFLIVTFHRRDGGPSKPYLHEGVPFTLWDSWNRAESAGRWYNANLKGRYPLRSESTNLR